MQAQAIATVVLVEDVAHSLSFYERELGFRRTFVMPWFASMVHSTGAASLDLWQRGHESMPRAIDRAPSGVVLALVVADARAELARLKAAGVPVIAELRDEPWGQRHFIIADPSGFLIDVVERIEPCREWLEAHGLV